MKYVNGSRFEISRRFVLCFWNQNLIQIIWMIQRTEFEKLFTIMLNDCVSTEMHYYLVNKVQLLSIKEPTNRMEWVKAKSLKGWKGYQET